MKLRFKMLALIVAASSVQTVQAGGCGKHGKISFGNGGISIGPIQIQPSVSQYQRHYPAPCHQSMPSHYESGTQVVFQDPNSFPPAYPQSGQPVPFPPNVQQNPNFPGQPGPSQGNPSVPFPSQSGSSPMNPGQMANSPINGMPMQNNGSQLANNGMNMPNNGMNMQSPMQPNVAQGMNAGQSSMPNGSMQPNGNPVAANSGAITANGASMPMSSNMGGDNGGLTALQILGSFGGGNGSADMMAGTPTATQIPPNHIGTWVVNTGENQFVKLVLQPNNTFVWIVIKEGKESRLEGQYRMDGQRLVLVRSSDLQQMAGSWTGNGSNFTFKLDGAPDNGLPFARAQ